MSKEKIKRARELRQNATPPERAMWKLLRHLRERGFHFRRQVPMGKYFVDFAYHKAKIIIEIDGDTHAVKTAISYDKTRDKFLRERGYLVMRFSNREVLNNPKGVFEMLEKALF